jgi:hypothetical protein
MNSYIYSNASLKFEKQLLKVKLHQFVLQFSKEQGRSPSHPADWSSMALEYKRYKELRILLSEQQNN